MKRIILGFTVLIMVFSCANYKKEKLELEKMKVDYPYDQTVDNAIKIGTFYNMKYSKNKEQIEEGLKFIEEARNIYPDNNKLLVLNGNLYTIYGGEFAKKLDLPNIMKYLDMGTQMLDTAVQREPDNWDFLLWRGINSVVMPKQAGRTEVGIEDFKKLYEMENLPEPVKVMVLYYYAMGLKKNEQKEDAKKIEKELKEKYPNYKETLKNN
ncbi:MAG TPA: hypothetical protein PK771_04515 [Spirochaetota bacterium]|nr:hypothetical protein [Spirochaetota bacterium]